MDRRSVYKSVITQKRLNHMCGVDWRLCAVSSAYDKLSNGSASHHDVVVDTALSVANFTLGSARIPTF